MKIQNRAHKSGEFVFPLRVCAQTIEYAWVKPTEERWPVIFEAAFKLLLQMIENESIGAGRDFSQTTQRMFPALVENPAGDGMVACGGEDKGACG